jgi:hypothetical protein
MKPHPLTLTGLLAFGLAVSAAFAAEPLPYGHKDFVPTPEQPVYFRQTYGNYPGATPPLEWWEGTPTTKKVAGVFGNPPRHGETDALDFADTKSKNILWKMPVPGWSLSHPIVVGNPSAGSGQGRVFAVGEPDFVTCWDLDTGKQLWQRRIMPLQCDGLSEEKAAAGQKVLDLARAIWLVTGAPPGGSTSFDQNGNFYNDGMHYGIIDKMDMTEATVAKRTAFAEKLLRMVKQYRPDVEAFGDADLLKALDEDIAIFQSWVKAQKDPNALSALFKDSKARTTRLVSACMSKFGVQIGGYWWGYVGTADSTLASDGRRIYGVFDQGQVFALDLDGKIVWLQRDKGGHDNRGTFHSSPLLCGDLLLVRSLRKGAFSLRALDVKTGQVRWEAPLPGSNYTVPRLMRLPGADGKPVDVLINDAPQGKDQGLAVVRVSDGKLLGCLPYHPCGRGALMAVVGQQVTWSSVDDRGGGPNCSYRLKLEGADTVVAEKVFVLEGKERVFRGDFPTVAGKCWMQSLWGIDLLDVTTGTLLTKLPALGGPLRVTDGKSLNVVAGHYLITMTGGDNNGLAGRGGPGSHGRDDHMVSCQFTVIDIKDPAKPVVVAKNNLLGYKEPAADIIVSTYFKEFDPYIFAGCYKGSASYFMLMSGPVPAGNKLLIQSSAFLYCIGEK